MSKIAAAFSALPLTIADMSGDQDDLRWEAFVTAMLAAGPVVERRSRFGDKPALFAGSREIAHLESPGVIDLRITRAGCARVREDFGHDAAVYHDPARRDWIELHLRSPADLDRLGLLVAVAMTANA
jgi:Family of unknown function (DUF5519)